MFDESQRRIIDSPVDARRMVVAGPGSGKTATSIGLIEKISGTGEIAEADDASVLFVSFSRAAIQAAFDAFGRGLADLDVGVAAMTLDSFAWQLTGAEVSAGNLSERDFDRTIRDATAQLRDSYDGELDTVVHLIVDEAQDLSQGRRDLLCAMIDCLPDDAGVTVFGDPLQAIYEFLDSAETRGQSAWSQLEGQLRSRGIHETLTLTGSYRARRRGPKKVIAAAQRIRTAPEDERLDLLDDVVSDLTHLKLAEFVDLASNWSGTTAVLARTNAEALRLLHELSGAGMECVLRERARSRSVVAPWVAELWASIGGKPVTLAGFSEFAEKRRDVDSGWFRLLLHATHSGAEVAWPAIAKLCAASVDPKGPWFDHRTSGVVVSTVHQAKGLEWDNVAVVDAPALLRPIGRREPESELIFVALSRARDKLVVIDWAAPFTKRLSGTHLLFRPHPAFDNPIEVSVTAEDLRSDVEVGGADGQRALARSGPGAQMTFELLASGRAEWPTYRCRLGDDAVGSTTAEFGKSLAKLYRTRPSSGWPNLASVALEGIESRWAEDGGRFWLKPRPFGFTQVHDQGSMQ